MRINVYSQEITPEIIIERKESQGSGFFYWGVRFMLASPHVLHHTPTDDDRSAVTFWPADDGRTMDRLALAEIFERAAYKLRESYEMEHVKFD